MNRSRNKQNYAVFLLLNELMRNDRLPPFTFLFIAINVLTYLELFGIDYPSLSMVCLSVNGILKSKEWLRLFLSPFFHGDDWHLYYNMTSFAVKGRSLESRYGSKKFFVVFTVLCSLALVALEYAAFLLFHKIYYLDACAVGFSGVIFALKVLTTHHLPDGTTYFLKTLPLPSKYTYWAELILISIFTPNASFAGHLAGIIIGLLYIYGPLKYFINKISSCV